MANEVFFDTSGFLAVIDQLDRVHQDAVAWTRTRAGRMRPVTTEWIIGETCTLLITRKRHHVVPQFLDYIDRSSALLSINPDDTLLRAARLMMRRQADQGFSFVDCVSFCLMTERKIVEALSTDALFRKAGFSPVLAS
ncbi:MAG: type II toxin-antitoxin system VapC family toxin [Verrucomicrobia bacterium]|nr:type II toxin-antitoxin system VapC family toxin [Verrucomicrobiota bacterium]